MVFFLAIKGHAKYEEGVGFSRTAKGRKEVAAWRLEKRRAEKSKKGCWLERERGEPKWGLVFIFLAVREKRRKFEFIFLFM